MELIVNELVISILVGTIPSFIVSIIQIYFKNNLKKIICVFIVSLIFIASTVYIILQSNLLIEVPNVIQSNSLIEVPNVSFESKDSAELKLKNKGFNTKIIYQWDNRITKHRVISQDPEHGLLLIKGSTITLRVSKGKNINQEAILPKKIPSEIYEVYTEPSISLTKTSSVTNTKNNVKDSITLKTYFIKLLIVVLFVAFSIILIIKISFKRKYKLINFSKEKIKQSIAYYIEPTCIMETDKEMKIFSVLDGYFYKKNFNSNKLLIIADAGMGKTSLLINYHRYNLKLFSIKRLLKCYFIPLKIIVIPLSSINISNCIDSIEDKSNTIICLDAFDEDSEAIKNYPKRLKFLVDKCEEFKYAIITCRRNFFDTADISIFLKGCDFSKLVITSFQEKDVKRYISKRYNIFERAKKKKAKKLIADFYKNDKFEYSPIIISNIPDLINKKHKYGTIYELYSLMLENRINHICDRVDHVIQKITHINKNSFNSFLNNLAYDMYKNKLFVISEVELKDKLNAYVKEDEKLREALLESITDNFLLEKTTNNCFQFTHTTILEFLFVCHFIELDYIRRSIVRWSNIQKSFAKDLVLQEAHEIINTKSEKVFDLSKADLSNESELFIKIKNKWPTNSILKNVDFEQTNLEGSDLRGANLSGANLINANLENADLTEANLSGANLNNANLKLTTVLKGKFNQAKGLPIWIIKGLENNIFNKEKLIEAIKQEGFEATTKFYLKDEEFLNFNLSNKKFINIDFIECKFDNISFEKSTFKCVNFSQTEFNNVDFEGSLFIDVFDLPEWVKKGIDIKGKFSKKRLIDAIKYKKIKDVPFVLLDNANFENEKLEGIDFSGTSLKNADFSNSKLTGIKFYNSCLMNAIFNNTIFYDVKFDGANFRGANSLPEWLKAGFNEDEIFSFDTLIRRIKQSKVKFLSYANLKGIDLKNIDLKKVDFNHADLRGADLREANLAEANLQNADLRRANLSEANLQSANLKEADLSGCNLKGANLDNAQLNNAKKDSTTNLNVASAKNTILSQRD